MFLQFTWVQRALIFSSFADLYICFGFCISFRLFYTWYYSWRLESVLWSVGKSWIRTKWLDFPLSFLLACFRRSDSRARYWHSNERVKWYVGKTRGDWGNISTAILSEHLEKETFLIREFEQRRFWATRVNRNWAFFSLNIPWLYQIWIAKCLYT